MNINEESRYWFKKSNSLYSQAMDLLEESDECFDKAKELAKLNRKEG